MESNVGRQPLQGAMVGGCSSGSAPPSRRKRGGNRSARRQRQRTKCAVLREDCILSKTVDAALSPLQGGSQHPAAERPAQLQLLQQFAVSRLEKGEKQQKGQSIYVGITDPTIRLALMDDKSREKAPGDDCAEKYKKGEQAVLGKTQNKAPRGIDDGILLVVTARINGHPVRALIDSSATRCFMTPACVAAVQLKGIPHDVFLELGNGQKYLSRGYVPDVPVVTASLTVKIGFTITTLLHDVDLVLGMNWLELVNPVIDWSCGKIYLPNALHTALLQGDWIQGHVKAGTVTVISAEDKLHQLQEDSVQKSITILKQPRFWSSHKPVQNLRANYFKGRIQWGFLHGNNCKICNFSNDCKTECKHHKFCKIYVIEDEEVLRVKRMNVNARLPVRGTPGAAGYDLSAAQTAVIPAHDKCLVKTGLQIALPSGCYGRIAPRSGLAIKNFIDVGAGVVNTDYRGEVGVILFNFSNDSFVINMGDRIAQLIIKKIKTPPVKELFSLEDTDRGTKGFGSTGRNAVKMNEDVGNPKQMKSSNEDERTIQLPRSRQLITARQIQKLARGDNPVYLAIVRHTNNAPRVKTRSKQTPGRVARFAAAHSMSEGTKRAVKKTIGPKKDFASVAERQKEVIAQVPVAHRERLEKIIQEYRDIFPEQLPKGTPPSRMVEHVINVEPGSKPSHRPPYRLGPVEQDELEE